MLAHESLGVVSSSNLKGKKRIGVVVITGIPPVTYIEIGSLFCTLDRQDVGRLGIIRGWAAQVIQL